MIDRDKMINEIQEEKRLRQLIRKDLKLSWKIKGRKR